jgi:tetratricopeptide (TPR) repeat protein
VTRALLLFAALSTAAVAGAGADEHLLAGARRFRDGRFAEALIEFRVAQKLGNGGEAGWYAAACLVRLNRPEEAVEAFGEAEQRSPRTRDEVFDFYRAIACHDARLYACADRLLRGVGDRGGPRIRDEAHRLRAEIASILRPEPAKTSIDWYQKRARQAAQSGRPLLAKAYLDEAAGLSARRSDRYGANDGPGKAARGRDEGSGRTTRAADR